jgi:hypothetical protein
MVVLLFPTCFVNRLGMGLTRTENPRVGGSIPPLATIRIKVLVKNDTDVRCPIFTGHSLRASSSSIG